MTGEPLEFRDIPTEVLRAAVLVADHFKRLGIQDWQLGGIESRGYQGDRLITLAARVRNEADQARATNPDQAAALYRIAESLAPSTRAAGRQRAQGDLPGDAEHAAAMSQIPAPIAPGAPSGTA